MKSFTNPHHIVPRISKKEIAHEPLRFKAGFFAGKSLHVVGAFAITTLGYALATGAVRDALSWYFDFLDGLLARLGIHGWAQLFFDVILFVLPFYLVSLLGRRLTRQNKSA